MRDGVSNYQPHDCLLNRLFRRRSKKTLKLRVTGLCAGNSPVTGEFLAQMASNAENISIRWRHRDWIKGRWIYQYRATQISSQKLCHRFLFAGDSPHTAKLILSKIFICKLLIIYLFGLTAIKNRAFLQSMTYSGKLVPNHLVVV